MSCLRLSGRLTAILHSYLLSSVWALVDLIADSDSLF